MHHSLDQIKYDDKDDDGDDDDDDDGDDDEDNVDGDLHLIVLHKFHVYVQHLPIAAFTISTDK